MYLERVEHYSVRSCIRAGEGSPISGLRLVDPTTCGTGSNVSVAAYRVLAHNIVEDRFQMEVNRFSKSYSLKIVLKVQGPLACGSDKPHRAQIMINKFIKFRHYG